MVSENNNDWCTVKNNLTKARKRWPCVKKNLARVGARCKIMGYFNKAIVQSVLLYGSDTWVITDNILNKLRMFHNKIARSLTNQHIHPNPNDPSEWIYPDMEEVLKKAGLLSIDTYIKRRKETLQNYAKCHSDTYRKCISSNTKFSNKKQWRYEYCFSTCRNR